MAVVVGINKDGGKSYRSANPGVLSDQDMARADELNCLLEEHIGTFVSEHDPDMLNTNKLSFYWEFGSILRKIYFESGLIDASEQELFFVNARLHMDSYKGIFPKDDLKKRRIIPKQFFNLAGFPFDLAQNLNWSQWSYLFDNTYLMDNTDFESWFGGILKSGKYDFNEGFTRLWAESFNLLFKNVDLSEWSDKEFLRSLNCTLNIINTILLAGIDIKSREERRLIKKAIVRVLKENRREFILLQTEKITPNEFVNSISSKVLAIRPTYD